MQKSTQEKKFLINYAEGDKEYTLYSIDFEKVKQYCENECMGIKFLINANFFYSLPIF